MSDIGAGVIGAAVGAVFTAGGTWGVSARLDRQKEKRQLIGAIAVVAAEIQENRDRIDRLQEKGLTAHETGKRLTLGDWATNKSALAGLRLRNRDLWDEVVALYGVIYEAGTSDGKEADQHRLDDLKRRFDELDDPLRAEDAELHKEIRFFSNPFLRVGK